MPAPAAVWLHEAIARGAGTVLLEGDGLALVVDKTRSAALAF